MAKVSKHNKRVLIIIGIFCTAILTIGIVLTINTRKGIDWSAYERVKSVSNKIKPVSNEAKIISISGPTYKDYGDNGFMYSGTIKNIGIKSARFVKIYIYLYDYNGNIIESDWAAADRDPLNSGEKSPWDATFQDFDRKIRNRLEKNKTKIEFKIIY